MEQKVSLASAEVDAYKKRCELLQKQNASLMTQLNNLRALLVNQSSSSSSGSTASLIGGVTSSSTAAASNFISTSSSINGIVNTIVVIHDSIYNLRFFFRPGCRFVSWVGLRLIYTRFHTRTIQPTYFHEEEENKTSEISWISMSAVFKVNFTYRYKINMHRLG